MDLFSTIKVMPTTASASSLQQQQSQKSNQILLVQEEPTRNCKTTRCSYITSRSAWRNRILLFAGLAVASMFYISAMNIYIMHHYHLNDNLSGSSSRQMQSVIEERLQLNQSISLSTPTYERNVFESFTSQLQKHVQANANATMIIMESIETQFTPHVQHLVHLTRPEDLHRCDVRIHLTVSSPSNTRNGTMPVVTVTGDTNAIRPGQFDYITNPWIHNLQQVFSSNSKNLNPNRTLPGNVTIGIHGGDAVNTNDRTKFGCYGSSGFGGKFTITNFLEANRMALNATYKMVPWEDRTKVPIWRGAPWAANETKYDPTIDCNSGNFTNTSSLSLLEKAVEERQQTMRLPAVLYSKSHPDLLDAKFSSKRGLFNGDEWEACWANNATNGLRKVLPFSIIPKSKYYSEYQVGLVLGGIGAAFRTGEHLSTGTAVLLADYELEEWFTRFMIPYVHFIPLERDLGNLHRQLLWIRDNSEKVKEIGTHGKEFYEDYLSFEKTEEFYYELLYKLALVSAGQ